MQPQGYTGSPGKPDKILSFPEAFSVPLLMTYDT